MERKYLCPPDYGPYHFEVKGAPIIHANEPVETTTILLVR
jgi:hypothetical protein